MENMLNKGVLAAMLQGKPTPVNSVIQVVKIISNQETSSVTLKATQIKYKCLVTDGATFCTALLPPQFNSEIRNDKIKDFTVVKVSHSHVVTPSGNNEKSLVLAGLSVVKQFDNQICELHIDSEGYNSKKVAAVKRKLESSQNSVSTTPVTPNKVSRSDANETERKQSAPAALWKSESKSRSPKSVEQVSSDDDSCSDGALAETESALKSLNLVVVPIYALTIYSKNFYIMARITYKSELVKFKKASGDGTLFAVHLLDASGTQIRGTFYNEACSQFYNSLEKGQVYIFSNGSVRHVDAKQNSPLNNQFEITFYVKSLIVKVHDDNTIQQQQLSLVKIDRITDCVVSSVIDVLGIVRSVGDLVTVKSSKRDWDYVKRDITLIDDTNCEIKVSLWQNDAEDGSYNWSNNPVVCIQGAVVKQFNGRTLSLTPGSIITLNPPFPEAEALRDYREQLLDGGVSAIHSLSTLGGNFGALEESSYSDRQTIEYLKTPTLSLSIGNAAVFVTVKATVTCVRRFDDSWYFACPQPNCGRKVKKGDRSSMYYCAKCDKSCEECQLRYILYVGFSDHTGSMDFSLHNETAEVLFGGVTAQQLSSMKSNNMSAYDAVYDDALFQTWLCKLKVHMYDGKVKCTLIGLATMKLDWECSQLESVLKVSV